MNALDDLAKTYRCTLYEDSANFLKDERFRKKEYQSSANLWKMNAEDTRITTHELARQSEEKRNQAPQSEANVCRRRWRKCNLKKTAVVNCTEHPTQIRGCVPVPRTQQSKNGKLPSNYKASPIGFETQISLRR